MRRSVSEGALGHNNYNKFNRWAMGPIAFGGVALHVVTGGSVAQADVVYDVKGTNGGEAGMPYSRPGSVEVNIPYNTSPPGSTNYPADMYQGAENLNQAIIDAPDGVRPNVEGFSKGGHVVYTWMEQHPESTDDVNSITLVGFPCDENGIVRRMPEAQFLTGMQCGPLVNPNGNTPVHIWEDDQDPISNYHPPINLVDLMNMLAAYEQYHPHNPDTGPFTVSTTQDGRITRHTIHHDEAALVAAARSRGIMLPPEIVQFIESNISRPGPHPGFSESSGPTLVNNVSGEVASQPPAQQDIVTQIAQNPQQAFHDHVERPIQDLVENITHPAVAPVPDSFTPPPPDTYAPPQENNMVVVNNVIDTYVPPAQAPIVREVAAAAAPIINNLPPLPPPPPPLQLPPLPALPPIPGFPPLP